MNAALNVNIGQTIRKVISEKHISQVELARILDNSTTYVTRLLKKETIDTNTLCELCQKLDYNFFEEFMPKQEFSSNEEYEASLEIEEKTLRYGFYLTYPHIGNHITERLKQVRVTQTELSKYLGVTPQEVSRLLKNKSIDTGRLVQISVFLRYNFFHCFYNWYLDEDIIEANIADANMSTYFDTNMDLCITDLITNTSLDEYRDTFKKMINFINILYKENEELKKKLKLSVSH